MPLIDLQKSSNTVALVESFLGEFKPDDEGTTESESANKSGVKIEIKEEPVNDPQPPKESFINNSQNHLKEEVPNEVIQTDKTTDCIPVNKSNSPSKEAIEENVVPIVDQPPPLHPHLIPPPPPMSSPPPLPPTPPVKRKVR
jgi:hypothetical protein